MRYQIRRSPAARRDVRDFIRYLTAQASEATARSFFEALEQDLTSSIAAAPSSFGWFHETGPPYRAKLFKLSRTTYWIIYVVDDDNRFIEFVRFWNSAREPGTHGL